jgi:hypothetical protein
VLTRVRIRNFKRFEDVSFELGPAVVLIGPNNSGKTTALQALALWELGRDHWLAKRSLSDAPEKRPGVAINRRDLVSLPVPHANLLWRNLRRLETKYTNGKPHTRKFRIDVTVDGISDGKPWSCGFEFDYSNEESFLCRPVRQPGSEEEKVKDAKFTEVPPEAKDVQIAFLPPMSGLAAVEPKWEPGRINVLIGEGQTAQILRNLCYQIYETSRTDPVDDHWGDLCTQIAALFGVTLEPPDFVGTRGEITMQYRERDGTVLDISSAGRGLQQTVLLLAHLYAHPHTVLLLDEPDAHLEILRQRQIWRLLTETAAKQGSQIVAASHSEVVLNEAADKDMVIAFVGRPHRIDSRETGKQVLKALREIGFQDYYQAEQTGWVLYLEGETDLSILREFAEKLGHEARTHLERPFFHPLNSNNPRPARDHFHGLREAKPDLVGIAIFDRIERSLHSDSGLTETMWRRREIENYLCREDVLLAYARQQDAADDLFSRAEAARREDAMKQTIAEIAGALATLGQPSPWSEDIKASDEFLNRLFDRYFEKLGLPNQMRKTNYHVLARLVMPEQIDAEVNEKLDAIVAVARQARAAGLP